MTFENPDPTFAHQADRVHVFYQHVADIRDRHSSEETDARHVNLNNVMMAANAATAMLRLMAWAKEGGESAMIQALGLAKPEYINFVAEDLLRSARLFLLLESQFQIEALFRNILVALGQPSARQGFYNVAADVLRAGGLPDVEGKVRILNVGALLRNCMHSNGIHHGYKGGNTVETINGAEFRFEHGKRVQCGSWFHIITALTSSFNVVDEVLISAPVKGLAAVPDSYTEQVAAGRV